MKIVVQDGVVNMLRGVATETKTKITLSRKEKQKPKPKLRPIPKVKTERTEMSCESVKFCRSRI